MRILRHFDCCWIPLFLALLATSVNGVDLGWIRYGANVQLDPSLWDISVPALDTDSSGSVYTVWRSRTSPISLDSGEILEYGLGVAMYYRDSTPGFAWNFPTDYAGTGGTYIDEILVESPSAIELCGSGFLFGDFYYFSGTLDRNGTFLTFDRSIQPSPECSSGVLTNQSEIISRSQLPSNSRVIADSSGKLYASGYFYEWDDFYGVTSIGNKDSYLAKLAADGTVEWIVPFGSMRDDEIGPPAAGLDGEVFAGSSFQGQLQIGSYSLNQSNVAMAFVARIDSRKPTPPPQFRTQPISQTLIGGDRLALNVSVTGIGPFSFQWFRGAVPLPLQTNRTLVVENCTTNDTGQYRVSVHTEGGKIISDLAEIRVTPRLPHLVPDAQSVAEGSVATFSVPGSGSGAIQWFKDGLALSGQTNRTLILSNVSVFDMGEYVAQVSSSNLLEVTEPATLGIYAPEPPPLPAWTAALPGTSLGNFSFDPETKAFYGDGETTNHLFFRISLSGEITSCSTGSKGLLLPFVLGREFVGTAEQPTRIGDLPLESGNLVELQLSPDLEITVTRRLNINYGISYIRGILQLDTNEFYVNGRILDQNGFRLWNPPPNWAFSDKGIIAGPDGSFYQWGFLDLPNSFLRITPKARRVFFVAKRAKSGDIAWAKQMWAVPYSDVFTPVIGAVAASPDGGAYVAGAYYGGQTNYWDETRVLPVTKEHRVFVLKVSRDGDPVWALTGGPIRDPRDTFPQQITASPDGHVYLSGGDTNLVRFGTLQAPKSGNYVVKIDSSGNPDWVINAELDGYRGPVPTPSGDLILVPFGPSSGSSRLTAYRAQIPPGPQITGSTRIYVQTGGAVVNLQPKIQSTGPTAYQWFRADLPIPGETNQNISVQEERAPGSLYSLVAWNLYGRTTNAVAYVAPPTIPALTARSDAGKTQISWSLGAADYALQSTSDLSAGFTNVPPQLISTNFDLGEYDLSDKNDAALRFYRLKRPSPLKRAKNIK